MGNCENQTLIILFQIKMGETKKKEALQNMQIDTCYFLDVVWTQGCGNQHHCIILLQYWTYIPALQICCFEIASHRFSNNRSSLGNYTRSSDLLKHADTDIRKKNIFLIFRSIVDLFLVIWLLMCARIRDFLLEQLTLSFVIVVVETAH